VLLGGVDVNKYCANMSRFYQPQAPNANHANWACVDTRGTVRATFTPDQVCVFQYQQTAHAVVGTLGDPATWRCYR
jgi:hypothetical protein